MIISLYYSINCLLNLAILVLLYISNSPNIITVTSVFAASTALSSIVYFYY